MCLLIINVDTSILHKFLQYFISTLFIRLWYTFSYVYTMRLVLLHNHFTVSFFTGAALTKGFPSFTY